MREAAEPLVTPGMPPVPKTGLFGGLSGRLLWLTFIFVMIAEVLIFVPSVANMRVRWLEDKLNTAAATAVVIDGLQDVELPRAVQNDTLMATGTKAIVLRSRGVSRMVAAAELPREVDQTFNLAEVSWLSSIGNAFDTLIFGGDRIMRVYGPVGESDMKIELVLEDKGLRRAMFAYAWNVLFVSVIISLIAAALIFFSINSILIRPIRKLTASMQEFAADPADARRVLTAEPGSDELVVAGHHLAAMQQQLHRTLKEQKNLADLGLAVSKINHDMRNILASAQLMSDRLASVDDPVVKRFAPKLLRTIDRAVGYTTEVLSYGRTTEAEPRRRFVELRALVDEVGEMLAIDPRSGIEFDVEMPRDLTVDADAEQLFRVVHNICRNALQALVNEGDRLPLRRISVTAIRTGTVVSISIDDTGPGLPPRARENLFTAFRGSARSGGTGLGLAIARELVLAHGGTIALVEKSAPGTLFRIELPDRPVPLDAFRNRSQG